MITDPPLPSSIIFVKSIQKSSRKAPEFWRDFNLATSLVQCSTRPARSQLLHLLSPTCRVNICHMMKPPRLPFWNQVAWWGGFLHPGLTFPICRGHTCHCTLFTAHCTEHAARCTLHTAHCALHTAHCTLNNEQCVVQNEHCTLYTAH